MLVGDPGGAGGERAADSRTKCEARAVRADADLVAGRDLAALRVVVGELDLRLGPLELQLGDALDGRTGEERPVALEAQRAEEVLRRLSLGGAGRARTAAGSGATYGARSGSGARSPTAPNGIPPKQRSDSSSKTIAACGESSTSKRSASFAIQASSSGTGGITARRRRWTRPSRLTNEPSRSR